MRKALFILGDLKDSDIDWLAEVATRRDLTAGAVLTTEGVPSEHLFILLDGKLSVRVGARQETEVNVLYPGEFVGELSFLDSRPPSATVVTSSSSVVAEIPRGALAEKLGRDDSFAARFYRALGVFLAHRLRRLTLKNAGDGESPADDAQEDPAHELDPELLESVSLAAKRFEWIKGHLGGR